MLASETLELAVSGDSLSCWLENLYCRFNRPEFIPPDPLELPRQFADVRDREVVALITASLARGRVTCILNGAKSALAGLGCCPTEFLKTARDEHLRMIVRDFRYRFTGGEELGAFFVMLKRILHEFGSLEACFYQAWAHSGNDLVKALTWFVDKLNQNCTQPAQSLLASPAEGSACKRLNLFLRWMVRSDAVDPGGWSELEPAVLIVPLDIHLFSLCRLLKLTARSSPTMKTALEITARFRDIAPTDPVKYDFALTRLGIWNLKGYLTT